MKLSRNFYIEQFWNLFIYILFIFHVVTHDWIILEASLIVNSILILPFKNCEQEFLYWRFLKSIYILFILHVVTHDRIILEASNCKFVHPFIKLGVRLMGRSSVQVINYIYICSYTVKISAKETKFVYVAINAKSEIMSISDHPSYTGERSFYRVS